MMRDLAVLVLAGSLLGVGFNYLGLQEPNDWGLSWIAEDKLAMLEEGPTVDAVPSESLTAAVSDDPLAPPPTAQVLPEIPDVGRPVQIQIDALKQLFDAGAIFLVDAREDWEFAEGHIEGAINLPFETVGMDPAALEAVETGGKPIVTCHASSCFPSRHPTTAFWRCRGCRRSSPYSLIG